MKKIRSEHPRVTQIKSDYENLKKEESISYAVRLIESFKKKASTNQDRRWGEHEKPERIIKYGKMKERNMSAIVRNVTKICQHGKVFWYFDAPNHRNDWRPIGYAHGRKWRILESYQSGLGNAWITYKCEPVEVKRKGKWVKENDR